MTGKASVWPLMVDHVRTLRDARSARIRFADVAGQLLMPVITGGAAVAAGVRLQDAGPVIVAGAVLAGASLGLAAFVFRLRIDVTRVPRGSAIADLLDELFANASYSTLVGLMVVASATAGVTFHDPAKPVNAAWTGLIVAVCTHLASTTLMCLKRFGSIYQRLTI